MKYFTILLFFFSCTYTEDDCENVVKREYTAICADYLIKQAIEAQEAISNYMSNYNSNL